jgi:hypothetical protein
MEACFENPIFRLAGQYHLILVIVSFCLALLCKNVKWALFSGVCSLFYFLVFSYHCEIKAIDPNLTLRYVIWCGWTMLCCGVIYFLLQRKLVYQKQAVLLIVISTIEVTLQLLRFVDRHYFDLTFTGSFYGPGMATVNNLIVITCFLPILSSMYKGMRSWIAQLHLR